VDRQEHLRHALDSGDCCGRFDLGGVCAAVGIAAYRPVCRSLSGVVGKSVTAIAAISVFNVAAKSAQRDGSSLLDDIGARERRLGTARLRGGDDQPAQTADTAGRVRTDPVSNRGNSLW
jgi:hypothetical protein